LLEFIKLYCNNYENCYTVQRDVIESIVTYFRILRFTQLQYRSLTCCRHTAMKLIVTINTSTDVLVLSVCVYDATASRRSPVDCDTTMIKFTSLLTLFHCADHCMRPAAVVCSYTKLLRTPSGRASGISWNYCCTTNDSNRNQTAKLWMHQRK